jgi:hypothetical protein
MCPYFVFETHSRKDNYYKAKDNIPGFIIMCHEKSKNKSEINMSSKLSADLGL